MGLCISKWTHPPGRVRAEASLVLSSNPQLRRRGVKRHVKKRWKTTHYLANLEPNSLKFFFSKTKFFYPQHRFLVLLVDSIFASTSHLHPFTDLNWVVKRPSLGLSHQPFLLIIVNLVILLINLNLANTESCNMSYSIGHNWLYICYIYITTILLYIGYIYIYIIYIYMIHPMISLWHPLMPGSRAPKAPKVQLFRLQLRLEALRRSQHS